MERFAGRISEAATTREVADHDERASDPLSESELDSVVGGLARPWIPGFDDPAERAATGSTFDVPPSALPS